MTSQSKLPVIVNDSEENDDWIRSLPSAKSEREISEKLVKDKKRKKSPVKSAIEKALKEHGLT